MDQTKEDLILGYITNQIALLPSLSKQYTQGKSTRISFLKLRSIVDKFMKTGSGERLILMPGLRGVGKTTLLLQLYEHIKQINEDIDIIYLSCDNLTKQLNSNLHENLDIYEKKILAEPFEILDKKIILLVDEAHYDSNWQTAVKSIFDRSKNVLIIVSGSSSIAIETTTDLARRMYLERIYPLNFPEYLLLRRGIYPLKGAMSDIRGALFESSSLETAYKKLSEIHSNLLKKVYTKILNMDVELAEFISKGGVASTLELNKQEDVFRKTISVLDKVVYQDIVAFYPSCKKCVNRIFPILHVLANATDRVSYEKLLSLLHDKSSKSVIFDLFQALTKAGVINHLMIEGSPIKMARNSMKYYFASPSIRASLLWSIGKFKKDSQTMGLLMENAVFNTLYKINIYQPNLIQNIYYGEDPGAPDFKIETPNGMMVIECGWGRKGSRQVSNSKKQKFSIIVSSVKAPKIDKENQVLYVPREMFLLMG